MNKRLGIFYNTHKFLRWNICCYRERNSMKGLNSKSYSEEARISGYRSKEITQNLVQQK